MDWCVGRLVKLICSRIILRESHPGRLLVCRSLVIGLLVLPPLPSGRVRSGVSCLTWTIMVALTHLLFPIFLKRTAYVMAPRLIVVFRRLACLCSFPACSRQANITPIPKGPSSFSVANYRAISITLGIGCILSKYTYKCFI